MSSDTVCLIAEAEIKPDYFEEMMGLLAEAVRHASGEPGCIIFVLHQDASNPRKVLFYEVWASEAERQTHLNTPDLLRIRELSPIALATPFKVTFLKTVQ